MAQQVGDPEALHLYQLIGAPLLAVVQAEAQAAQASAEFIRRIGFESAGQASTSPDATALQDGGDFGPLRTAKFTIQKADQQGRLRAHEIQVPVLSLFPIPLLQVKDAEFDFGIRILTRAPLDSAQDKAAEIPQGPAGDDFLNMRRVELKGSLARGNQAAEKSIDSQIRVKVRMSQSDIPAGLAHLLNIMSQSVTARPKDVIPEPEGGGH